MDATAATDTGLAVGLRKGIGEVNVMQVRDHLNISSDMFVVRDEVLQQKKSSSKPSQRLPRRAVWMIANPEEAATLAGKYAISGAARQSTSTSSACAMRLRCPPFKARQHLLRWSSFDLAALQKGADVTYRALGMVQRQIRCLTL